MKVKVKVKSTGKKSTSKAKEASNNQTTKKQTQTTSKTPPKKIPERTKPLGKRELLKKHGLLIADSSSRVHRVHKLDAKGWYESGRWVNVTSSNVKGIMYDKKKSYLYVEFKSNAIYVYRDIDYRIAKNMFNSTSMGKFVWYVLRKNGYSYSLI